MARLLDGRTVWQRHLLCHRWEPALQGVPFLHLTRSQPSVDDQASAITQYTTARNNGCVDTLTACVLGPGRLLFEVGCCVLIGLSGGVTPGIAPLGVRPLS